MMPTELQNVKRSEVTFVRKLHQSEFSAVFKVVVRRKECVMKVVRENANSLSSYFSVYAKQSIQYQSVARSSAESTITEKNIFICESTAYRRLKAKGLRDDGYIPHFFGIIRQIRPKSWQPHLDMFIGDKLLPNAILIEYIPHMQMINLSTFTPSRMSKLVDILEKIHAAGVLHNDPYPRNMMVVPGNPDRVLWIDFDRAQTFSKALTERQQGWFDEEVEMMDYFAKALVSCTTLNCVNSVN